MGTFEALLTRDKDDGSYRIWPSNARRLLSDSRGIWGGEGPSLTGVLCGSSWHRRKLPKLKPGSGPVRVRITIEEVGDE